MEFHISRAVREKLDVDDLLFSYAGNVIFANVAASRRLAQRMMELRESEGETGARAIVNAGALFAMGLIDELTHAMVERYREEIDPSALTDAVQWFAKKFAPKKMDALLLSFVQQFPSVAVYRGEMTAAEWLAGETGGMSHREAAMEEMMLLWLANSNPGFKDFAELFEDSTLREQTVYDDVTSALPDYFATRPEFGPEVGSLIDVLRAPILASPDSLTGQLDYIREHWAEKLGPELKKVLLAIDTLREEDIAIWMRFNPAGPEKYRHGAPGRGGDGFVGDEYVGFDEEYVTGPDGVRVLRKRYSTDYQAPLNEYEAFSADQAWMPNVVLMAKSTYVWLEQLSKKYGRHIHRLDHIPDEELRLLNERGITGLWLIGLWERSVASRTIKRLRGHHDAVASAYSLKEYNIAEDLGGNSAYENLRDRAARFNLRLASDMVPNHMGIDSPWVIEHPDWFVFRWESPYPTYSFNGPDLSTDPRVEIKLDDHYYDQTDAAVAFRLKHHSDGSTRYVYHGNDGTTFAWNDTAQIDYSKAYVREHVMQAILHVARLFPIIRFDAAMVLAKRHVQRLWFPLPGAGGSIPSRAENAMSQEEFDALMPLEFWREVVDRVAVEVPGTLLLAEAFWLLEGYFVRTLGMHRVYNSAFMNMLRDEENAKYRSYLKKTMEFDPDILKRYVNFMSNPDEKTAIDQFGSGDKYFGVATLLATLPGLPMFGHGQIEGYTERYGMEYKTAKMEEWPDERLVARHQREIAPLLKDRSLFAESTNFVLYDFWTGYGTVNENVFAYSNMHGGQRAVIVYNNAYDSTDGTIHTSVGAMDKGTGEMRQRALADGLGVPWDDRLILAYRDLASGLEYLRRATDVHQRGMSFALRGYQYIVLLDWRELRGSQEWPWDTLCDELDGQGVPNLDEALAMRRMRPLHQALRSVLKPDNVAEFRKCIDADDTEHAAGLESQLVSVQAEAKRFCEEALRIGTLDADGRWALPADAEGTAPKQGRAQEKTSHVAEFARHVAKQDAAREGEAGKRIEQPSAKSADVVAAEFAAKPVAENREPQPSATGIADAFDAAFSEAMQKAMASLHEAFLLHQDASREQGEPNEPIYAALLAWLVVQSLPWHGNRQSLFDALQLRPALARAFEACGIRGEDAWRAAARVRLALSEQQGHLVEAVTQPAFWRDADARWLAGVNEADGRSWMNKESLEALLLWLSACDVARGGRKRAAASVKELIERAADAGYDLEKFIAKVTVKSTASFMDKFTPSAESL
jgi:hypothetical protein